VRPNPPRRHGIRNGFKVGTPAGKEDTQVFHHFNYSPQRHRDTEKIFEV
jgi:hypothetical protein